MQAFAKVTATLLLGFILGVATYLGVLQVARGAASPAAGKTPTAHLTTTILPGMKLGPDHRLHDAFSPANFRVVAGERVDLTILNYDNMPHSFTASGLGLNVTAAGSPRTGVPGVTVVHFTVSRPGTYSWQCVLPCDLGAGGWAMSHAGFMTGSVVVTGA